MKRYLVEGVTVIFLTGLLLISGIFSYDSVAASPTQPVILKQSCFTPAGHPYTLDNIEFAEIVAKATGGRVKIEVHPSASLCPPAQELSAVHSGSIDMTTTVTTYLAGVAPLVQYTALPWFVPPTKEGIEKLNAEVLPLLEKSLQKYNIRLLMTRNAPNNSCLVSRKPIRTPADLKGLRIRTAGGLTDLLAVNWGASVVSLPISEAYSALQRGIVDATLATVPSVKGMRIYEVAPYITDLRMGLNAFLIMVNKDKWNQISKTDQKAILDVIPSWIITNTEKEMKEIEKERAGWAKLGIKVYNPTPSEMELWKAGAKPLWTKYAKSSPEAKKIVEMILKNGGGIPTEN